MRNSACDPAQSYVGCFGRIRHQKGTDQFVDAMIALLPRHPGWSAIVAGRATAQHVAFERDLIRRVAEAGLENRILFVGEHADIARWYRALTLFVAPQRWEGFGMTPLEAMASGVPVVATDAGAFGEMIVENETGAVVPAGDGEALRESILPYLADPALAQAHGGNALEHIKANFPLVREVESIRRVYDRLWARG